MKRNFEEQIKRIYYLTYGKKVINEEGILDKLLNRSREQKIDDPKKADIVTADVKDFFKTIETAINAGGLSQQQYGSMSYQKEVESMQIGLMLLGYELPQHGVDGLFGPETGAAVEKFKQDNSILNESSSELRSKIRNLGYKEKGAELTSGGEISNEISNITSDILTLYKQTNPDVSVIITAGNDRYHKNLGYKSKHQEGNAIDLVIKPYNTKNANDLIKILNSIKNRNNKFSYINEYVNPSKTSSGGHFHLQYGNSKNTGSITTFASPEMLKSLLNKLKSKGVSSDELSSFIDVVSGVGFTDLDVSTSKGYNLYAQICQKFIDNHGPNPLGITGEMMAIGARNAFQNYKKYVPPELALSQLLLEGGIQNKNINSRPIKTKNPFNVGNIDSGSNVFYNQVQLGINSYYNLIAKNYLGKGKSAKDLLSNFVNIRGNRYATAPDYEEKLNTIALQVNKIALPITSKRNNDIYI